MHQSSVELFHRGLLGSSSIADLEPEDPILEACSSVSGGKPILSH
jgi:hypothetical protein